MPSHLATLGGHLGDSYNLSSGRGVVEGFASAATGKFYFLKAKSATCITSFADDPDDDPDDDEKDEECPVPPAPPSDTTAPEPKKPKVNDIIPNETVKKACFKDVKGLALCDDVYCGGAGCYYPHGRVWRQDGLEEDPAKPGKPLCPKAPGGGGKKKSGGDEGPDVKKMIQPHVAANSLDGRIVYFKHRGKVITKGGDIPPKEQTTLLGAKKDCTAKQDCKGFSFKPEDKTTIFKSKWQLRPDLGNDWNSYRKVRFVFDRDAPTEFNGSTSVRLPKDAAVPGDLQRAVGFWMKTRNQDPFQPLFSSGSPKGAGSAFNLRLVGGMFAFSGYKENLNPDPQGGQKILTDGQKHLLVASYDGADVRLFVDGFVVETKPMRLDTQGHSNFLGASNIGVGSKFSGEISRLFVADSALSDEEVYQLWLMGADKPFSKPRPAYDSDDPINDKDQFGGPAMQHPYGGLGMMEVPTLEMPPLQDAGPSLPAPLLHGLFASSAALSLWLKGAAALGSVQHRGACARLQAMEFL